jgi:hypothetical protein
MNEYEREREARIARNNAMLKGLGLGGAAEMFVEPAKPARKPRAPRAPPSDFDIRRSDRNIGKEVSYLELGEAAKDDGDGESEYTADEDEDEDEDEEEEEEAHTAVEKVQWRTRHAAPTSTARRPPSNPPRHRALRPDAPPAPVALPDKIEWALKYGAPSDWTIHELAEFVYASAEAVQDVVFSTFRNANLVDMAGASGADRVYRWHVPGADMSGWFQHLAVRGAPPAPPPPPKRARERAPSPEVEHKAACYFSDSEEEDAPVARKVQCSFSDSE